MPLVGSYIRPDKIEYHVSSGLTVWGGSCLSRGNG